MCAVEFLNDGLVSGGDEVKIPLELWVIDQMGIECELKTDVTQHAKVGWGRTIA